MKTTITILCDNSISKSGFIGEHGFALSFERGNDKYLFDTGPGMSLPINLDKLNMSLINLRKIFISHGHYDHTGGLKWVLQQVGKVEIVAHKSVFSKHMVKDPDTPGGLRYIGCPFSQEELEQLGADFHFLDRTEETAPGIWFLTGINPDPQKLPHDP